MTGALPPLKDSSADLQLPRGGAKMAEAGVVMEEFLMSGAKPSSTQEAEGRSPPVPVAAAPGYVDFDRELRYWRSHYPESEFCRPGLSYEDYEPALKLGINVFLHGHGSSFEEQDDELADAYYRTRGASPLDWNEARPAAAAAWQRMGGKSIAA